MSTKQHVIGLVALGVIALVMAFTLRNEDTRRLEAARQQRVEAVERATALYAENCVVCHGAAGEGIGPVPALAADAVRSADANALVSVIARGRYNTTMGAWAESEGGILSDHQIYDLVTLVQDADWLQVRDYVDAAGLMPPQIIVAELDQDLLAQVAALPNGDTLTAGLMLYAENCVACHNVNGEGSSLAPELNTVEYRAQTTDEEMQRIITQGVPGTLMAGWERAITADEVATLVFFLREWETLNQAQIALPVMDAEPATPPTPEMIAEGAKLFSVLCRQCHGTFGQGTPLAPALNTQNFLTNTPDPAVRQIVSMGIEGTVMPAWGGRLTDNDISAIVAYIRSWQPTAPPVAGL